MRPLTGFMFLLSESIPHMAVHEKVKCEQCGSFRGGVELPAQHQRLGWGWF